MKCSRVVLSKIAVSHSKLWALAILVLASPAWAQSQKWDTSYVADDTYFMIGLNVQHLLEYEKEDSSLRSQVAEMLQEGMGIEVEELDQFQFLMGGKVAEGEDDDDMLQIKLIFNKPQKLDSLLEKIFGNRERELAEHHKLKYYKSTSKHSPSVYAPTEKMVVIANDNRLFTLMESEKSMGDVVDRIKQANGNADMFLTFDHNEMTERMVAQLAKEMKGLPFDIQDIASEAKHGSLTVDLADDKPLIGMIEAKDKDGAERLKRAADALVALGKTGIPQLKRQLDAQSGADVGDDEFGKKIKEQIEMAQKGLEHAEAALDGTTVETAGSQVEIKVSVMGGSVDGARFLVQSLFAPRRVRTEAVPLKAVARPDDK